MADATSAVADGGELECVAASEDLADFARIFYVVSHSSRVNVSSDRSGGPWTLYWVDLERIDRAKSKFDLGVARL